MQNMPKHDREMIAAIVTHALALGYEVSCADTELDWTTDSALIFDNLGECDEERIGFRKPATPSLKHWVYLVYGNGQGETVCDYRNDDETRKILAVADALATLQEMEYVAVHMGQLSTEVVQEAGPGENQLILGVEWSGSAMVYTLANGGGEIGLDRIRAVSYLATRPADEYRATATAPEVLAVMAEVVRVPHKIDRAA